MMWILLTLTSLIIAITYMLALLYLKKENGNKRLAKRGEMFLSIPFCIAFICIGFKILTRFNYLE